MLRHDSWPTLGATRASRATHHLGSLNGVETGIRQLIRRRPVETERIQTPGGVVVAPTLSECARIKAWLVLIRNATRDYLDLAALTDELGSDSVGALSSMDDYYADQRGQDGGRIVGQLAKQMAEPVPYDLSEVDLGHYRGLALRWHDWSEVRSHLRDVAAQLLEPMPGEHPPRRREE